MKTKILAFSGKKQAGKDTMARFLVRNATELFGGKTVLPTRDKVQFDPPDVQVFSLAYKAKKFLVDCMGLTEEQVWGTDLDKNTLTKINWEDLPHYFHLKVAGVRRAHQEAREKFPLGKHGSDEFMEEVDRLTDLYIPRGLMKAREVMEQFMEGVMRKMYPPSVKEPCLKQIAQEAPDVAVISDLRRQEEFHAIRAAGGKVVRLTRTTPEAAANTHISNVDLDADRFDWSLFDGVIDNHNAGVTESCGLLVGLLKDWGWLVPAADINRIAPAGG